MAWDAEVGDDLWSRIAASEQRYPRAQYSQAQNSTTYSRKITEKIQKDVEAEKPNSDLGNRLSWEANQRVSWNRYLSTRGRTSIALALCPNKQPLQGKQKRKPRPAFPKGKAVPKANYDEKRAYFEEVDSFELPEESPSPKHSSTWIMGAKNNIYVPPLSSAWKRWFASKRLTNSRESQQPLSKILETPDFFVESCHDDGLKLAESWAKTSSKCIRVVPFTENNTNSNVSRKNFEECSGCLVNGSGEHENSEDVEVAIRKLTLSAEPLSLFDEYSKPYTALLTLCGQSESLPMSDVFSKYGLKESIVKVGEGTYGEAFIVGSTVCKIVPIDGDFPVNAETQKSSEELLGEAILSQTLNRLRGDDGQAYNSCTCFIKTIDIKVCQGCYDAALIRAWEEWDVTHCSENDDPKDFPESQSYVMFILEHGGRDLENFVLSNFDEARSLLVQVTATLAVAEAAFEFEHRDLHWGNILLSRREDKEVEFVLEGRRLILNTFGLFISIIDFTLSRINTGNEILFMELSSDHELFEGPKGDKQSETYRKMREITEDCWEGSFPKTNVLWLQYLVDILLLKKSFSRTPKNERDLRALKKSLGSYSSAKDALFDSFFMELMKMDQGN